MSGLGKPRERIVVLAGGESSEREISLESARGVSAALERLGYESYEIDCDGVLVDRLRELKPDIVFNALHGGFGEDGGVQALLEWMHITYTGSGVAACTLAMDKHLTKKLLAADGLPTAAWEVFDLTQGELPLLPGSLNLPVVVKPRAEGSSTGISIVRTHEEWADAVRRASENGVSAILAESFIAGREFTVGVLGGEVLPVIEIAPAADYAFYSYDAKYTPGGSAHTVPARIDDGLARHLQELGLATHRLLGLRDYSRTDILLTHDDRPMILEINALPGLTPLSLIPESCAVLGIDYDMLVDRLIGYARTRSKITAAESLY
jgi:D-alanine-D-alanine ligase